MPRPLIAAAVGLATGLCISRILGKGVVNAQESVSGQEQRQCETTLTINDVGKITNHCDVWQGEHSTFYLAKRFMGGVSSFFAKS